MEVKAQSNTILYDYKFWNEFSQFGLANTKKRFLFRISGQQVDRCLTFSDTGYCGEAAKGKS